MNTIINEQNEACAWVLATKTPGDKISSWIVDHLYKDSTRLLEKSERCRVTSFCYPSGAKLVRAKLVRP